MLKPILIDVGNDEVMVELVMNGIMNRLAADNQYTYEGHQVIRSLTTGTYIVDLGVDPGDGSRDDIVTYIVEPVCRSWGVAGTVGATPRQAGRA